MNIAAYPLTKTAENNWHVVKDMSGNMSVEKKMSCLIIGTDDETEASAFASTYYVNSLKQAHNFIGTNTKVAIPDVILIKVPYNKSELSFFAAALKKRKAYKKTIIIYCLQQLTRAQRVDVAGSGLVDDIVDICNPGVDLVTKVNFLRKVKGDEKIFIGRVKSGYANKGYTFNAFLSLKRAVDILAASVLLILLSPLFLVIALVIKLGSKGPVIYKSKRAGKGYKVFEFYKFRTMEMGADKKIDQLGHLNQYKDDNGGAKFLKIANDPRITKMGKFLRNTSIDELPQLINVLKGDMSLVGNRPLPLYEAATLTDNNSVERFMAPAGITGLWQIEKRGREDMSTEERINLDITYAREANFLKDMWILVKTPIVMFQKCNS
jgi:lipopolysaccharide/colanic/teichoic acid biosynthesis glycosyltransferase